MGEKKPAEPMGLAVMRERFKYAATSQCVNWEPSDVADMALTLEALAEVFEAATADHRVPSYGTAREVRANAIGQAVLRVRR